MNQTTRNQAILAAAEEIGALLAIAPYGASHDAILRATARVAVGDLRGAAALVEVAAEQIPAGYKAAAYLAARHAKKAGGAR
jgi:hypothetical protein